MVLQCSAYMYFLLFQHTNEKYFNGKNFPVCDLHVQRELLLDYKLWWALMCMWTTVSLMVSFTLSNSIFKVATHVSNSVDVFLAHSLHTTHRSVRYSSGSTLLYCSISWLVRVFHLWTSFLCVCVYVCFIEHCYGNKSKRDWFPW